MPLLVTARLASPLAGDAPHLDSLLEWLVGVHLRGSPGAKLDRSSPPPPQAAIPIPVARRSVTDRSGASWRVSACSSPILADAPADAPEHVAKRIGVERADLIRAESLVQLSTKDTWTKSYRLPLRCRAVPAVAWFALGWRSDLRKELKRAAAIGNKTSYGYGRVASWEVAPAPGDYSWFAPSPAGPVLMRPLPDHPGLPGGLVGYRRDFGAAVPPYWHPGRYTEVVVPC